MFPEKENTVDEVKTPLQLREKLPDGLLNRLQEAIPKHFSRLSSQSNQKNIRLLFSFLFAAVALSLLAYVYFNIASIKGQASSVIQNTYTLTSKPRGSAEPAISSSSARLASPSANTSTPSAR